MPVISKGVRRLSAFIWVCGALLRNAVSLSPSRSPSASTRRSITVLLREPQTSFESSAPSRKRELLLSREMDPASPQRTQFQNGGRPQPECESCCYGSCGSCVSCDNCSNCGGCGGSCVSCASCASCDVSTGPSCNSCACPGE